MSKSQIAGVDEAGRGPLAGPVVAAAVILPAGHKIKDLDDSKKLTAKKRAILEAEILNKAIYNIALCEIDEIDSINILQATMAAMTRAVTGPRALLPGTARSFMATLPPVARSMTCTP